MFVLPRKVAGDPQRLLDRCPVFGKNIHERVIRCENRETLLSSAREVGRLTSIHVPFTEPVRLGTVPGRSPWVSLRTQSCLGMFWGVVRSLRCQELMMYHDVSKYEEKLFFQM